MEIPYVLQDRRVIILIALIVIIAIIFSAFLWATPSRTPPITGGNNPYNPNNPPEAEGYGSIRFITTSTAKQELAKLMENETELSVLLLDSAAEVIEQQILETLDDEIIFENLEPSLYYVSAFNSIGLEMVTPLIELRAGEQLNIMFPRDFKTKAISAARPPPLGDALGTRRLLVTIPQSSTQYFNENGISSVEVFLYNENGQVIDSQIVAIGQETVIFDQILEGVVYVGTVLPDGRAAISELINLNSLGGGDETSVINSIYVSFPEDFENAADLETPPENIIDGIEVRSLHCRTIGDFDDDGAITQSDYDILLGYLDELQDTGIPPEYWEYCADINGDGYLTTEDQVCLSSMLSGVVPNEESCAPCTQNLLYELCGDGIDNNCDGQTDRETYSPEDGIYGGSGNSADLCECNVYTGCLQVKTADGLPQITNDGEIRFCANIKWASGETGFNWQTISDWTCDISKSGYWLDCEGYAFECSWVNGEWDWRRK